MRAFHPVLLILIPFTYLLQTRRLLRQPTDTSTSIYHVFLHSVYTSLQLAVVISQHVAGSPVFGCTDFYANSRVSHAASHPHNGTPDGDRVSNGVSSGVEMWTFMLGLALPIAVWIGSGIWCYEHIHVEFVRDQPVTMDHIVEQLGARRGYKSKWLDTLFALFLVTLLLPLLAFFVLTPWAPLLAFVPMAGIIGIAQFVPEVISMRQNKSGGGLSKVFLQNQAMLFSLLAVGWGLSAGPYQPADSEVRWGSVGLRWYFGGGGVAINFGIHAVGQMLMLVSGWFFEEKGRRDSLREEGEAGERTSLLARHDQVEE
ncbi:MAG: hypothetical protein Q9162_004620 [Coniocarpon cinnabarinum]